MREALPCKYLTDRFVAIRGGGDAPQIARDIALALRRSFDVAEIHLYVPAFRP